MRFDDEPVPGYPLPIRPGHVSPGRLRAAYEGAGFTIRLSVLEDAVGSTGVTRRNNSQLAA